MAPRTRLKGSSKAVPSPSAIPLPTRASLAQTNASQSQLHSPNGRRSRERYQITWRYLVVCGVCLAILYKLNPDLASKSSLKTFTSKKTPLRNQLPLETTRNELRLDQAKRDAVLDAFQHSYSAYERDAFGYDDYHPISHKGTNMSPAGPVGYFIIDSLDSLLLMGFDEEYKRARDWVSKLSFDIDDKKHTFEITIRVLGGLLSAYHLSGNDSIYLEKAIDLGDRLLPAFDSPSGLPYSFINLHTRKGIPDRDNRNYVSVAEAGTLQLEFKYLSEVSGNPIYGRKASHVIEIIRKQKTHDGLVPIFLSPETGKFVMSDIRLGSRADSYYEYLPKMYLQTNRTEMKYLKMHQDAMRGVKDHLLKLSPVRELIYTQELIPIRQPGNKLGFRPVPKQDHLVCFLGGNLLLGATEGRGPVPPDYSKFSVQQKEDFYAGVSLIRTCVDTYLSSKTGLAPEIVNFYTQSSEAKRAGREWFINSRKLSFPNPPIDARNILRPETIESLFVAYRITADPIYREWGWTIFKSFVKHCKLPEGGFASVLDVDSIPVKFEDRMETFWISETLKYFYLLFGDENLLALNEYVFNTEAHPLPVFTPRENL